MPTPSLLLPVWAAAMQDQILKLGLSDLKQTHPSRLGNNAVSPTEVVRQVAVVTHRESDTRQEGEADGGIVNMGEGRF